MARRRKGKGYPAYTRAGPVRKVNEDGTVETWRPFTPEEWRRIVGRRGRDG